MATKPQNHTDTEEQQTYGVYFTGGPKIELEGLYGTLEGAIKAREELLLRERGFRGRDRYDHWFGEGDPSGKN
jgi:hypothetical protein